MSAHPTFDQLSPADKAAVQNTVDFAYNVQENTGSIIEGAYQHILQSVLELDKNDLGPDQIDLDLVADERGNLTRLADNLSCGIDLETNPIHGFSKMADFLRTRILASGTHLAFDYGRKNSLIAKSPYFQNRAELIDSIHNDMAIAELFERFVRVAHLRAHVQDTRKSKDEMYEIFSQSHLLNVDDQFPFNMSVGDVGERQQQAAQFANRVLTMKYDVIANRNGGFGRVKESPDEAVSDEGQIIYPYLDLYFRLPWQKVPEAMHSQREWRHYVKQVHSDTEKQRDFAR